MAENQVKRFPFSNKGMVQKLDVNQLDDGQYAYILNMVSQQEGSLSPRNGYTNLSTSWGGGGQPDLIDTMLVARDVGSITDNPYIYLSYNNSGSPKILRRSPSGSSVTTLASNTYTGTTVKRPAMCQFKTDQLNNTGTVYFGTGYNDMSGSNTAFRGMLRDDGTYSTARVVGVLPPSISAYPTIAAPTIGHANPGFSQLVIADQATTEYPTVRVSTSVTSYTKAGDNLNLGTLPGWVSSQYTITLGSVADLQAGMLVQFNNDSTKVARIESIDAPTSTIVASCGFTPTGDVKAYETPESTLTSTGGTLQIPAIGNFTTPINLAMGGTEATNYDSDDIIHLSFYNGTPNYNNKVAFRLYSGTGYYEYVITLLATNPNADTGGDGYWAEYDIPKTLFTKNGVGSGSVSWQNITTIQLTVTCFSSCTWSMKAGTVFGYGGGGPNSSSSGAFIPYQYVYTYYDPQSGAESNPSPLMSEASGIYSAQQNISVILWGCDSSGERAGTTQVNVYRSGGTFTDGYYRKVGFTTNPGLSGGVPVATSFLDTATDSSITSAKIAEFDNNAPITSNLNKEYAGTFTASNYYGWTDITPSIGGTDLRTILTPGTQVLIGGGQPGATNQEFCTVFSVTSTTFKTFLTYSHVANEKISWSTNAGIAGDILLSAMDCLWMAGDPNNPHVLYRSKTARPESWPIINEGTGNAHLLAISSPDNPIMGLAEFNGEIVCLCRAGIYTVRMDSGVMRGPIKTPANRGLLYKQAWGYIDNGIWFLSYDGIYAWNGSTVQKVSFPMDFVFNKLTLNDTAPYNQDANYGWSGLCNIQQRGNVVYFNYIDTSGVFSCLRYNLIFDRWSKDEVYDSASIAANYVSGLTSMFADKISGNLYAAKMTTVSGPQNVAGLITYDNPGVYTDGGQSITYGAISKVYDIGEPFIKKNFTDVSLELTSGSSNVSNVFSLDIYYDYASTSSSGEQTITVTPGSTARQVIVNPVNASSGASAGREARAVQWKIYGTSVGLNYWHALSFGFIPLSELTKGKVTDWSDLGHPYDKRLVACTIEYDNNNSQVQLYLDTVSGINGNTTNPAVQTITLPASSGRSKVTVPIVDGTIAKMVRLRPVVASSQYQVFDFKFVQDNYPADRVFFTDYSDYGYEYQKRLYQLYINCDTNGQNVSVDIEGDGTVLQTVTVNGTASNRMQQIPINPDKIAKLIRLKVSPTAFSGNPSAKFQLFDHRFDYENLPKETILSTPWTDFGYDYNKYAEQLTFDVNTNGYNVPVKVYGDGVLEQTVTVSGTQSNRNFNATLNPGIVFQIMRLEVDPAQIPSGGCFQLWEYKPVFQPADKGPVLHTFDWDDLGHPYDKKISEVTIEFETNSTDSSIQVAIDTLTGIDGSTTTLNAITLTLPNTSTGRGKKTFPLPETICKMVRIRSLGQNSNGTQSVNFKMWGYQFGGTIPYPADTLKFTDWTDAGYPCAKIFRGVGLQIDTGGVNCTVALEVDGVQKTTWAINTTQSNRQVFLTPPNGTEINGYLWRLTFTPGSGGKAQLFVSPEWNLVKDGCDFVVLDSYNQAFGSAGFTIIKQIWADYICAGTVTMTIYDEDGNLCFTKQLPSHATRAVERFYVPSVYNGVINKSKKHRILIQADDPTKRFRWYRDSSRVEYLNLSADQRKGYYQFVEWQNMQLPV